MSKQILKVLIDLLGQDSDEVFVVQHYIYTFLCPSAFIYEWMNEWMNEWTWLKWRCHSQTVAGALYNNY